MTFADSDEGRALRDSMAGYLGRHLPIAHARDCYEGDADLDRAAWDRLADDLGLPGLAVPEKFGGLGAGFPALAVALEETGRVILPEPLLPSVLSEIVIDGLTEEATRSEFLPRLASGQLIGTLAGYDSDGGLRARRANGKVVLDGTTRHVVHATAADLIVAFARGEKEELVVALVDGDSRGLAATPRPTLDRSRPLADLTFESVQAVDAMTEPDPERLGRVRAMADLALAAEQLGGARGAMDMAVSYANTRIAFGRPIGAFQAIKHKLARVFIAVESAAAVIALAAAAADSDSPELSVLAATAKARGSEAFVQAASENIQVHGGIGFTWEHDSHLFLKRARGSFELLGSPSDHYLRIAEVVASAGR